MLSRRKKQLSEHALNITVFAVLYGRMEIFMEDVKRKYDWATIPNLLSLIRIILVVVFCVFYFKEDTQWLALFVLVLSGLTDTLDGYIARHFNQVSNLGKVLDPFADKLFTLSTVICFSISGFLPWWITAVIIAKELVMIFGGLFLYKKIKGIIPARWYGKVTTVLFFATFILSLFFELLNIDKKALIIIVYVLFCTAIIFSLFSLVSYIKIAVKMNKEKTRKDTK